MISVFNQDIKGFVYLGGMLIASVVNILVMALIKSPISSEAGASCNLITFPFLNTSMWNSPSYNSMVIAFTSTYLIAPMYLPEKSMGQVRPNYAMVASMVALFMIDAVSKLTNNCTNVSGVAFGGLLGTVLGFMWFSLLRGGGASKFLYFNSFVTNKEYCSRPSKQQFICKPRSKGNGELIVSN